MITSIVVDGCHNIRANATNKIKIGDNVLSIEKDIPFIRYRFDTYTEKEYQYMTEMINKFNCSTHLAEIKLSADSARILQEIQTKFERVAKYIYVEVTEEEVQNHALSAEKLALLSQTVAYRVDRYMIKDKSISLDTICAKTMIKQLCSQLRKSEEMFGVCSSPLSFSELACLTAVKARELMSVYSTIADVALPSANHQCMNCCGCIRYLTVTADTEAPADAKPFGGHKKEKVDNGGTPKKSSVSKSKPSMIPGMFSL